MTVPTSLGHSKVRSLSFRGVPLHLRLTLTGGLSETHPLEPKVRHDGEVEFRNVTGTGRGQWILVKYSVNRPEGTFEVPLAVFFSVPEKTGLG